MRRHALALAVLCVLAAVVGGWLLLRHPPPQAVPEGLPGIPGCALATLPPEAADTVAAIHSGGPFPYPRNDGVVFGNREGHLPARARAYYHEYTVPAPGSRSRSTRRIITGGTPPQFFYTGDHYDSFRLITDTEGPR